MLHQEALELLFLMFIMLLLVRYLLYKSNGYNKERKVLKYSLEHHASLHNHMHVYCKTYVPTGPVPIFLFYCLKVVTLRTAVVNRTEARFGIIRYSVWLGSVLFSFLRKTEPNIYRIKSKIKGFHEVFNRNIFFQKFSNERNLSTKEHGPFKNLCSNGKIRFEVYKSLKY